MHTLLQSCVIMDLIQFSSVQFHLYSAKITTVASRRLMWCNHCVFPNWLAVAPEDCWHLLGKIQCNEGAASKTFKWLLWLLADCQGYLYMEYFLTTSWAVVKFEQVGHKPEMEKVCLQHWSQHFTVSLQLGEWLAIVCRKAHHFYSNYYRNMLETKAIIRKFLLTGWRTWPICCAAWLGF